ncbi:hypothetical protein EUGRSUZ_K01112 [Eucalyptus grandis]|uniref:Uncharacterized protein n=2 Tax=Eucalyptus grandis TaxID=71139 RepID=A0ACC3ISB1_EUCGR|nr:hypothetical protein EUGRSUZ_K01112 [Eucalyptus grandis]
MDSAYLFIKKHGFASEAQYPYTGTDGKYNTKEEAKRSATIKGYENVPANSEEPLLKAVANQPVFMAIDAGGFEFQIYSSGVFTGACGTDLKRWVAMVGYETSKDGTKYGLVNNSWGAYWGEEGYIRMQRGVDVKEGLGGIAIRASYPSGKLPKNKLNLLQLYQFSPKVFFFFFGN